MGELSKEPARLQVVVEADEADLVSGQLWDLGCLGIEERDEGDTVVLLAGFSSAIAADRAAGSLGRYTVLEELGGGDYLDLWREHATWHRAGHRIVVRPTWVAYDVQPVDLVLHIEPGRTFGSGSHPSTRAVLAALERTLEGGERVLDVGCGSGVLSVAAARLGATEVVGIDIDPAAPSITEANAHRNGVAEMVSAATTPLADVPGTYDIVAANIGVAALTELGPQLAAHLRPGGRLILAGVLHDQIGRVVDACRPLELVGTIVCDAPEDDWPALILAFP